MDMLLQRIAESATTRSAQYYNVPRRSKTRAKKSIIRADEASRNAFVGDCPQEFWLVNYFQCFFSDGNMSIFISNVGQHVHIRLCRFF